MWVLKAGDLFDQRYRIQREIGAGGMSFVYAAQDEELQETVALKIIRPELVGEEELVERFKREVRITRQIHHPNIIRIFEFGRTEMEGKTFYYLTMELLPGMDLGTWLRKRGSLTLSEVSEIAVQLCDALSEAHRMGVIHRDIKPQNIFMDNTGRATLMDFGISRLATLTGLTRGSQLMGTPRYMSPEQVSKKQELDHRTDIYSLGIVLYELCTRRVPFAGQTPVEVAIRHVQEAPEPPRSINAEVPPTMEKVILTCLEKDPNARYATAEALRAAVLTVAQESGVETRLIPSLGPASTPRGEGSVEAAPGSAPESFVKAPVQPRATPLGEAMEGSEGGSSSTTSRLGVTLVTNPWGLVALVGGLVGIVVAAVMASLFILGQGRDEGPVDSKRKVAEEPTKAGASGGEGLADAFDSESDTSMSPSRVEPAPSEANRARPAGERPAQAGYSWVTVSSNPGTRVYVDGEHVGTIPPVVQRELREGRHRIRYLIPEYDDFEETVVVQSGQDNAFAHHFAPFGVLRVVCQPFASVRVDGREVGYTPINIKRVREGEHRLVLYREGFQTIDETVAVRPGLINLFQYTLVQR